MRTVRVAGLAATVLVMLVVGAGQVSASVRSASAASAATPAAGGCSAYTPISLTISVPQATPGQTVTITGKAQANATVSISFSGTGFPAQTIGTAVASGTGAFTANVKIPSNALPNTYTITVTSPVCPSPGVITIVVPPNQTITCASNPTVIQRGQVVTWKLLSVFDKTQNTALYLQPQFLFYPIATLFSGHYPASGQVVFTVSGSAPDGSYYMTETGVLSNLTISSQSCAIRVSGAVPTTTTTTTTTVAPHASAASLASTLTTPSTKLVSYKTALGRSGSDSSSDGRSALIAGLAVVAAGGLISLKSNRRHRRRA